MPYLSVGNEHELYYHILNGNSGGIPMLFVYGGPSAGVQQSDERLRNPIQVEDEALLSRMASRRVEKSSLSMKSS